MTITRQQNDGQSLTANVSEIVRVTDDIRVLYLKPETDFCWQAGQYVHISFAGLPPRPYSIACAPESGTLEIHVKRGTGKLSNYIMDQLRVGDKAAISSATGQSIFDSTVEGPVLAIAGGLGIAPIKAIAEQAMTDGFAHTFSLYWGTGGEKERYLDEYFQELSNNHDNFEFFAVSAKPVTQVVAEQTADFSNYRIFISGPPPMISTAIDMLLDKGARREKISYDRHPEAANIKL